MRRRPSCIKAPAGKKTCGRRARARMNFGVPHRCSSIRGISLTPGAMRHKTRDGGADGAHLLCRFQNTSASSVTCADRHLSPCLWEVGGQSQRLSSHDTERNWALQAGRENSERRSIFFFNGTSKRTVFFTLLWTISWKVAQALNRKAS